MACGLLLQAAWGQEDVPPAVPSRGSLLARRFESGEVGLANFSVLCLDAGGRLVAGSDAGGGLKSFDGVRWSTIASGDLEVISALVTGGDGLVWAGGHGQVACFGPAAPEVELVSQQLYASLGRASDGSLNSGFFKLAIALPDGAVLASATHVVIGSRRKVRGWAIPGDIRRLSLHGGTPQALTRDGKWHRFDGTHWTVLPEGAGAEPDAPGRTTPLTLAPAAKAWLAQQRSGTRLRLPDGRVAVATRDAGVIFVREDGEIDEHFTSAHGLASELCYELALDRQGGLWISHYSSLTRLDLHARVLGRPQGLRGPQTYARRAGPQLLISGQQGVWTHTTAGTRRLAGATGSGYAALQVGKECLVSGHPPISVQLSDGTFREVAGTGTGIVSKWAIAGRRTDEIYGGGAGGVWSFRRDAEGWVRGEAVFPAETSTSDLVALGDGILWRAESWGRLSRIDLRLPVAERKAERVTSTAGKLPPGSRGLLYLLRFEDRVLVAMWKGFFRWDAGAGQLVPDAEFAALAFPGSAGAALAASGDDWVIFQEDRPPGRVKLVQRKDGKLVGREVSEGLLRGLLPESLEWDPLLGRVWLTEGDRVIGLAAEPSAGAAAELRAAVRVARDSTGSVVWREGGAGPAVLPAARRDVAFDFAANDYRISFAGRPALEFRSRLTGFDPAWSEWAATASRSYTNLSPGNYVFEVEARTLAGAVLAAPPLALLAPPQWWETWWARGGFAGGAALLLALGTARWAQRRLRDRLRRLNVEAALQQERLRIARDMHDGVGSGLGRLRLALEQARKPAAAPERDDLLAGASEQARELAEQAREIIWAVTPENDTLDSLLDRLAETVRSAAQAAGLRCRLDLPESSDARPVHAEARHQIVLALKEAVHNAVKHAQASELRLRAAVDGGRLALELQDDGRGFDPSAGRPGGLGLGSLRARAEALSGGTNIESSPGGGTTVRFWFPLATAAE